jgi:hypothetical protein
MDTREFKGLELAARAAIEQRKTYWYVPSAGHEGGYKVSSFANLEFADGLGAVPYVPFKVNARGDNRPGIWETMFCQFTLNREAFLKRYHLRSNVESTFSAIKRKFGDAVRSKTDVAIRNEVLAKVLCHNLAVVIHEMHELGIDPEFAPLRQETARILRFPDGGTV